ncbi:MAG: hypothetical protein Barrevirus2_24 [Barrevirus sp.]|uniref:Uncharacterized protein n=1 Tax=Barrevirus sp. TaxID=2487763 RepID=A0A3G4ZS87_9VIRU|nr:MAG: hypothetical protein Barrevirus2_24 [Barrevirus sp.]
MKLIPLYFFIVLFIGFLIIYTFKNKQHWIEKNKRVKCDGNMCFVDPTTNKNNISS